MSRAYILGLTALCFAQGGTAHALSPCAGLLGLCFVIKAIFAPSKQIYGLTNSRAIIAENRGKGSIRSFGASQLGNYSRKGGTDIGTVEFTSPSITSVGLDMSSLSGRGFYEIQDPKYVENLIYKHILNKGSSHE